MTVGFMGLVVWWTVRVLVWIAIGVIVVVPLGLLCLIDELAGEGPTGATRRAVPPAPPRQPIVAPAPMRLAA